MARGRGCCASWHEVLPAAINLSEVAARIEDHRPDVALVRLHATTSTRWR